MGIIAKSIKFSYGIIGGIISIILLFLVLYVFATNYITDLFERRWLSWLKPVFQIVPSVSSVCSLSGDIEACKEKRNSSLNYMITITICSVICLIAFWIVFGYDIAAWISLSVGPTFLTSIAKFQDI